MTVYTGSTFQTCALRVWGVWVSMRDLNPRFEFTVRTLPESFNTRVEAEPGAKILPRRGET
jgi:hypothetical protein